SDALALSREEIAAIVRNSFHASLIGEAEKTRGLAEIERVLAATALGAVETAALEILAGAGDGAIQPLGVFADEAERHVANDLLGARLDHRIDPLPVLLGGAGGLAEAAADTVDPDGIVVVVAHRHVRRRGHAKALAAPFHVDDSHRAARIGALHRPGRRDA